MTENNFYFLRLLARSIDFSFIALIVLFAEKYFFPHTYYNIFLFYLLYSALVVLLNGNTLGKYIFILRVRTPRIKSNRVLFLLIRELLFPILLPILFFNLLFLSPIPLHDRITGTRVEKDEI